MVQSDQRMSVQCPHTTRTRAMEPLEQRVSSSSPENSDSADYKRSRIQRVQQNGANIW
jgi:hypothetical protein